MEQIQYVGLEALNDYERSILDKISPEYYEKYTRCLQNEVGLKVHIKAYEGEGKKAKEKKFAINVQVTAPTKKFEAHDADWDFSKTLHKVFKDLEKELEHNFKKNKPTPQTKYAQL